MGREVHNFLFIFVWACAALANACLLRIVFGSPAVISRSGDTCQPMPAEVARCLRSGQLLDEMKNVQGPTGSQTLGTFCVRCLVWRPPDRDGLTSHHCRVCQRCVSGFDHHCMIL